MIDKSKIYRTRDGREVRIYATDGGGYWPIQGAVQTSSNCWMPTSWDEDGTAFGSSGLFNLIEVRPRHKRTVWLNVYPDAEYPWPNKEMADKTIHRDGRIACIKVDLDFEEGDGL